jgi:hypothetical protein
MIYGTKLCSKCGPERGPLPLTDFSPDKRKFDGRASACVQCCRESVRKSRRKRATLGEGGSKPTPGWSRGQLVPLSKNTAGRIDLIVRLDNERQRVQANPKRGDVARLAAEYAAAGMPRAANEVSELALTGTHTR